MDDGKKAQHLLQGAFSPSEGFWTGLRRYEALGPVAELADALRQLKRRFLAPRSRRDFIARLVKLFAEHGEKNDHDRSNDRSQEQPQKSKGFYSAKDKKEQYQGMQLDLTANHPWPDDIVGGADDDRSPQ